MKETNQNRNLSPQTSSSEELEITEEEIKLEKREQLALQELITILESDAEKAGKPVNAATHAVPMEITTKKESGLYVLRINPAIIAHGKLNILVLDLYAAGGNHFQQWVVKSEWENGEPKIIDSDNSSVYNEGPQIRLTEIAEYAAKILRGDSEEKVNGNPNSNFTIRMPAEYSKRVN
jgi:hypothetical protein